MGTKTSSSWATNDIRKLSKTKNRLWHKNLATKWKSVALYKEYTETKIKLKKACVKARAGYEEKLAYDKQNPKHLYIVFLDFAKAFDKVNHQYLITKLANYGIEGKLLDWIKSFLKNRRQRVVMGESVSSWVPVSSGVPQGSVLGPLLFAIFINDLHEQIKSPCKMFADDTKIIGKIRPTHAREDQTMIQDDINRIADWCEEWLMFLNTEKCKVMKVGKRTPMMRYTINDRCTGAPRQLEETNEERDLGILITRDLKPRSQVHKAASRANMVLALLRNIFVSRDPILWKKLYTTYVRPHLEYAVAAWNPYTIEDKRTLEKVQRRATSVTKCMEGLTYEERLLNLGLTTLERRRERGDMIQMYKIQSGRDHISWLANPSTRATRNKDRTQLTKEIRPNIAQRANFFTNRAANQWNKQINWQTMSTALKTSLIET